MASVRAGGAIARIAALLGAEDPPSGWNQPPLRYALVTSSAEMQQCRVRSRVAFYMVSSLLGFGEGQAEGGWHGRAVGERLPLAEQTQHNRIAAATPQPGRRESQMTTPAGRRSALDDPQTSFSNANGPRGGPAGAIRACALDTLTALAQGRKANPRRRTMVGPMTLPLRKRWRSRMSDSRPRGNAACTWRASRTGPGEGKVWTRPRPAATGRRWPSSRRRGPEQGGQLGTAGNSQLGIDAAQVVVDRADR
jgi:hypothetical protein